MKANMNFVFDETMSSLQIAQSTGKTHGEIIADLLALVEEMHEPEKEGGLTFVNFATFRNEVRLTKLMTYRLIMRYTRVQQDFVRIAWGDFKLPDDAPPKAKRAKRLAKA